MKGTVLITGGAGSVGKCVAQRLCDQGSQVRVFDLPPMDFSGLEDKEGIEIIRGDLTKAEAVEAAIQDVGAVIHLAALMPPGSEKNRAFTFAVNVEGTTRLAEMLKRVNPEASFCVQLFSGHLWRHKRQRGTGYHKSAAAGPGYLCREQDCRGKILASDFPAGGYPAYLGNFRAFNPNAPGGLAVHGRPAD